MTDKPDDVPALDEIGDGEELPDYWTKNTTITVPRYIKTRLDTYRDGKPWAVILEQLRQEHADPVTMNDISEIAAAVGKEVEADVDKGELGLAVADYLMTEYNLPAKVAEELRE